MDDIKRIVDKIVEGHENDSITVDLRTLIWTIVTYSYRMKNIEDEIYNEIDYFGDGVPVTDLVFNKECIASRRDELANMITRYSKFDTRKIWSEIDLIFPKREE